MPGSQETLVEVEREVIESLAGKVVISEDLVCVDGVIRRVIFCVDLVVNDPLRHGARRINGQGRVGNRK